MLDGLMTDVVERTPLYEKSGYTRQLSWIDREIFQPRKIEFYDRRNALLKTLTLSDYRDYDGVWRAHSLEMINHQTGKSTSLNYGDFSFANGLDANDFEQGVLTRIR
jgi:outer membrane lipoprotein-sorting protein